MALEQPLTSFSDRMEDGVLRGIDEKAPRIRQIHRALDDCADEAGPQRYELACLASPSEEGLFVILAQEPSPALSRLFEIAPGVRMRFSANLALSIDLTPPNGDLRVIETWTSPCDPHAPMDVFLRVLEQEEGISPASLEGLFEDIEQAGSQGLLEVDPAWLSLTAKGRDLIRAAGPALEALNDETLALADLYAQEVADQRLSLREAIAALERETGLRLPAPGQPDEGVEAPVALDGGVRIDTTPFAPLLIAVAHAPQRSRGAVMTVALHGRLVDWGLSPDEASSLLRHDIRCLRALGASLSHGPLGLTSASSIVEQEGLGPIVDTAAAAIDDMLLQLLAGPMRAASDPGPELTSSTQGPGLLRRILMKILPKRPGR